MDLRHLTTFRMVATTLNFTQAASALGYVQSSVTAQIQALEKDLGIRLFDRFGRRVTLTDAGERLLVQAERLLSLAEKTRAVVTGDGEPGGSLTISAAETLCTYRLPAVLRRFKELNPSVRLTFLPVPVRDLRRLVNEGHLDLAFILERPIPAGSLSVKPLAREEILVIAPPDHPLTSRKQVRAIDLADEQVLLTELGCSYRNQFEHTLIAAGVYPTSVLEFGSIESIKQCVMAGLGVAVLPAVAVRREVEKGLLVPLAWADPSPEIVTQMVWHKDRWLSPALRSLIAVTESIIRPE